MKRRTNNDKDRNVAQESARNGCLRAGGCREAWGADLPKSPVMLNPQFKGTQPIDVFVVPVGRWSDGSAAPVM
jgi:hypothetical protein